MCIPQTLTQKRTTIGFGSKNQGEEKVHGAPLGDADIAQVKTKFGFNPDEKFFVSKDVYDQYAEFSKRGAEAEKVRRATLTL